LQKEGAKIKAYDPQGIEEARKIILDITFTKDPYQAADSDALLILTDWPEFKELELEKMRKIGFVYKGVRRG